MILSFHFIDHQGFIDFIRRDERPGVEWGLKWFLVLPELARYFAVLSDGEIVGVYYLNSYLTGFELGVYVSHSKRESGILRQLMKLLAAKDLYVEISHHNSVSFEVFRRLGFQVIHRNANSTVLKKNSSY